MTKSKKKVAKKPKAVKKVVSKPKPAKVKKTAPVAQPQLAAPETQAPAPVVFEGAEVVKVLEYGDHFNLCKMSDETTKHVPVKLFA